MSGKRLYNFREGDRSEYIAVFGLSRISFVTPVPRQEDFGVVDLRCVLAKKEGNSVYPQSAFNVQVKSSGDDLCFDAGQIRWISNNMDCPLFLCIINKAAQNLKMYSCSRIWLALFFRMHPRKITLRLDEHGTSNHYVQTQTSPDDIEGEFEVFLGPPVLDLEISELEKDSSIAFGVMDAWIHLDVLNIARMRLGRCAVRHFPNWGPNLLPGTFTETYYYRPPHQHDLDQEVIPFLVSLGMCYKRFGQLNELTATCEMLKVLDPLLNDRLRHLANSKFSEIESEISP